MDALSEVLKVLRFNSAIFFNARFTAPWCLASPQADAVARQVHAGSERLLFYHFHALPPMLEGANPQLFRQTSLAMEADPTDWRGHFMASAFILTGKRA